MPPAYIVHRTYLTAAVEGYPRRPGMTLANRMENEATETDCSGRALATLVIAWVGAALVASVLLKWTQMWVALAVLTFLFLAACTYAAYDARKTHERALAREEERQLERTRRRQEPLNSVSNGIDNFPEIIDPPEYQTYWVSDLPPSYNAAIGTQPTSVVSTGASSPVAVVGDEIEENAPTAPRLSNPPPYAIAIQTEPLFLTLQSGSQTGETTTVVPRAGSTGSPQSGVFQTAVEGVVGQTSSESGLNNNLGQQLNNATTTTTTTTPPPPPRYLESTPAIGDEDKIGNGETNDHNNATVGLTRTQYLASIFNSTFGRSARRAPPQLAQNNNVEQNGGANGQTDNQNNRNRAGQSVVQYQNSTNNDRNLNNNGGGNGIQSSHHTAPRLSD